jgi:hypothetical protein
MTRPTPSLVISLVALVFSMTGAGLAASHYIITSTKQIKPSALAEIRGKAAKVGTVAGPTGPPGPPGPSICYEAGRPPCQVIKWTEQFVGQKGETGAQGPRGFVGKWGPAGCSIRYFMAKWQANTRYPARCPANGEHPTEEGYSVVVDPSNKHIYNCVNYDEAACSTPNSANAETPPSSEPRTKGGRLEWEDLSQ